jgi:hypothetical protein
VVTAGTRASIRIGNNKILGGSVFLVTLNSGDSTSVALITTTYIDVGVAFVYLYNPTAVNIVTSTGANSTKLHFMVIKPFA